MNAEFVPSSIEDLHDEILTEILCRLPCKSAFSCKCVSNRWLSLISKPDFAVQTLNTNHMRTKVEWTLLIQTSVLKGTSLPRTKVYSYNINITNNPRFEINKFGLEFLPFDRVYVASTFKDLVLCYTCYNSPLEREYHICNPFTKQWTSLPSCPPLRKSEEKNRAALLVCEECFDYDEDKAKFTNFRNADYRYRVVVEAGLEYCKYDQYHTLTKLGLVVFCSEAQQWKKIILVITTKEPTDQDNYKLIDKMFQAVVYNKMLYFRDLLMFGSFDPFDVTPATADDTIFSAKNLPSPGLFGTLVVSEGRLLMVSANNSDMKLIMKELKLENDRQPLRWEVIRESGSCNLPLEA